MNNPSGEPTEAILQNYTAPESMAELLERYARGERYFAKSELDDVVYDLRNANLQGINLSQSFLLVDFRGANLQGANFSHANVKTCDFRGADLSNPNFSGAAICAADFEGAVLVGADFSCASYHSYIFGKDALP
jgi:uncharacterized protein YjbI with pentapeptide repeats